MISTASGKPRHTHSEQILIQLVNNMALVRPNCQFGLGMGPWGGFLGQGIQTCQCGDVHRCTLHNDMAGDLVLPLPFRPRPHARRRPPPTQLWDQPWPMIVPDVPPVRAPFLPFRHDPLFCCEFALFLRRNPLLVRHTLSGNK